ncbi:MAG: hypothetical protein M3N82_00265 [Pseudomonadota bacterium]|nr:hypothetical protein [Pseudomonadota bacterium]
MGSNRVFSAGRLFSTGLQIAVGGLKGISPRGRACTGRGCGLCFRSESFLGLPGKQSGALQGFLTACAGLSFLIDFQHGSTRRCLGASNCCLDRLASLGEIGAESFLDALPLGAEVVAGAPELEHSSRCAGMAASLEFGLCLSLLEGRYCAFSLFRESSAATRWSCTARWAAASSSLAATSCIDSSSRSTLSSSRAAALAADSLTSFGRSG